jgi:lysyl-tRNA synthetase class 2
MAEAAELVGHCGAAFGHTWSVGKSSYRELFLELTGVDPMRAQAGEFSSAAVCLGIDVAEPEGFCSNDWLDLLMTHSVQDGLAGAGMTLVYDYPASQAALARIRPEDPPIAERFELYVGQVELANGYQELTNVVEQRQRFEQENRLRRERGQAEARLDENLLSALESGLPHCAGVALGVDRLLMACLGAETIEDVITFPTDRA